MSIIKEKQNYMLLQINRDIPELDGFFAQGESVIDVFVQTYAVKDALGVYESAESYVLFTNKRILFYRDITNDSFACIPFKNIADYYVSFNNKTGTIVPSETLEITTNLNVTYSFKIKKGYDLRKITREIDTCIL